MDAVTAGSAKPMGVALIEFLIRSGLLGNAERDNRRFDRTRKREAKHAAYHKAGLNGVRAMARRARQRGVTL